MRIAVWAAALGAVAAMAGASAADKPTVALELPPSAENVRNSEGDIIPLRDGRLLFVYSHYLKGTGNDNDPAVLAARVSSDGGRTWSARDRVAVANEGGMNVMSVSLLRLRDGALALFYLRKNSTEDCRPVLRVSRDEGETWGAPRVCVPDSEVGYYVMNNSRALRLKSGRIVLPLSLHQTEKGKTDFHGQLVCYVSDDEGLTWRRGCEPFKTFDARGRRITTQEPGLVELKDGGLLMFARTDQGRQWRFLSADGGLTWGKGEPWTLVGPISPATVKRLRNGDLVAVWNDHETYPQYAAQGPKWAHGTRKPMTVAFSKDEGRTWIDRRVIEDLPTGWYCYFSVLEMDSYLLISYCAEKGLQHSRISIVPL